MYKWSSAVDQSEHYYQLALLGKDAFLRAAAPAALIRRRGGADSSVRRGADLEADTLVANADGALAGMVAASGNLQIFPLAKKRGAPFADMITVGRTPNNDVVVDDVTVSRFHAFFREKGGRWIVCDSGSKNGTRLDAEKLEPRKEMSLTSGSRVRIGDVNLVFYTARDLFDVLSGSR